MSTIDLTNSPTTTAGVHPSQNQARLPYSIDVIITGAAAAAEKGSALAAADIIQAYAVPAESAVLGMAVEVETADSGTTLTFDIGVTGGTADGYVDGGDGTTAGYLAAGSNGNIVFGNMLRFTTTDTIDVLLKTESSSNDDWVLRLRILVWDTSGNPIADSA